jgi:hypothetical protein
VTCCWVTIVKNSWGSNTKVPVMIARGGEDGPVVGLTAGMPSPPAAVYRLSPAMDAANQKPSVCSIHLLVTSLLFRVAVRKNGTIMY